jgi:hypothetical protein
LNIDGQETQVSERLTDIYSKFYGQAERAISNGQLNPLTGLTHPSYQRSGSARD